MSNSSPADLAVAFRSLPRRLKEASPENASTAAIAQAQQAVSGAISAAAGILGSAADAEAVAAAIQARKAREWTDTDLRALQDHAYEAARAIRALQDS
jgi:hypothetical protein